MLSRRMQQQQQQQHIYTTLLPLLHCISWSTCKMKQFVWADSWLNLVRYILQQMDILF